MNKKTALIFGATGLIGKFLVQEALKNPNYDHVIVLVRKPLFKAQAKLKEIVIDFEEPIHKNLIAHDVFCAIGTTLKKAGSKTAQTTIDVEIPIQIASIAKNNGAKNFFLVSSVGANAHSSSFYLQLKGNLEQKLIGLKFNHLSIFRPSMLYGTRTEFRIGETIGKVIMKATEWVLFGKMRKYRGIEAQNVAIAMIHKAQLSVSKPVEILEFDQMMTLL